MDRASRVQTAWNKTGAERAMALEESGTIRLDALHRASPSDHTTKISAVAHDPRPSGVSIGQKVTGGARIGRDDIGV